jgi:outer membrane biosynthesis protein TonB
MSPRTLIRLLVAVLMLVPAIPATALAQNDGEVIVVSDNFDDPAAGILQEGSDDPDLRYDYDDDGYEIDAFADDFSGDLTVPVPGEFPNGTIQIDAALTGKNDGNGHYLFLSCRVRDETGYKLEIRPLAQVAAIWLLSPDGDERIASVGLEGDPSSGPFTIAFGCLGNELTGLIDGQEIVSVTDDTYADGSFAFGAGVYKVSAGPVSADFDNLAIAVPADEAPASPEASPAAVEEEPTEAATPSVTEEPAEAATPEATVEPTEEPTEAPTEEPTQTPTTEPTAIPTEAPPVSQAATFDRSGLAAAADQLREQASAGPPAFGPETGQTDLDTGLEELDFVASVSFTVPEGDGWSAGYAFRQTSDNSALLQISSNGAWMLTAGTEQVRAAGLVESLNTDPGDDNTIELIAAGDTGYLTVNGEFVAQLDLSVWPDAGALTIIGTIANGAGPLDLFDATVWTTREPGAGETGPTPTASPAPEQPEEATAEAPAEQSPEASSEAASSEASPVSQEEAATAFQAIVDSTDGAEPLSGPDSGSLTQAIGSLDIASAGVITENFYSTVRFSNPANADDPDHPWDIVIGFWHTGGDDQVRLVIASDGTWSLALGTARPILNGTVDNLNLGEARGNDIGLAVLDGTAYLSVNDAFVTSFEIPSQPHAGDLWLASGTFPENAQEGVQTPYSDWTIWSLEQG